MCDFMWKVIIVLIRYNQSVKPSTLSPGMFQNVSAFRILRIDSQWRYATLSAKEHGTRPDSHRDLAFHDFAANYVLRGTGVYIDESGQEYPITPGVLFQRLPGRRHSTLIDPKSDYAELFLVLDRITAQQMLALGLIRDVSVLAVGPSMSIADTFYALGRSFMLTETELPTPALLTLMIDFLNLLYERARQAAAGTTWDQIIRQACVLLESDLDQPLALSDVAQTLNIAYPTFRRRFREVMRLSPGAYRVRSRLERACYLLMEKSVKQVADELGYSDPFVFSAQFKAHFGFSPRSFQSRQGRPTFRQDLIRLG